MEENLKTDILDSVLSLGYHLNQLNPKSTNPRQLVLLRFAAWLIFGLVCFLLLDRLMFLGVRESAFHWYRQHESEQDPLLKNLRRDYYDMLIMGSSRSYKGLLPIHFYDILNRKPLQISLKGKYPKYNYHFYSRFRRLSKPPDLVIYGVDYHIFCIHSWNLLLQDLNLDGAIERFPLPQKSDQGFVNEISWLVQGKPQIERFFQDMISNHSGSVSQTQAISTYLGQQESNVRVHRPARFQRIPYASFPGIEGEYLIRLLSLLQEDGVRVYMVILPDYIGTHQTLQGKERFYQDIHNLCDRFSQVTCMNFHEQSAFEMERADYFADGGWGSGNSHLSASGARKLAELICERIAEESGTSKPGMVTR